MTTAPLVSCITIFLDEQRFLAEAIESVLAQTLHDWELILVDDGSTDGSNAIARDFERRHPGQIRCVEHPGHANLGMSSSRNLGLSQARGRYVGFLDGDDVWLPDKLQEQVAILEAHPEVGMVYGRTLLWRSWQPGISSSLTDDFCELGVRPDTLILPPDLVPQLVENRYQTPTTCNALLRRTAVERVGGFEPAFRGMFEDQVFFMKLCLAEPVYVAGRCWAKYRQRDDSCSARSESAGEVRAARKRLLDWLEGYLRRTNVNSARVWRTLSRQRRALHWPGLAALLARLRSVRYSLSRSGEA